MREMEYMNQAVNFTTGGVPSYAQAFYDIKWGVDYCLANCTGGSFYPSDFVESLKNFSSLDFRNDISIIVGLSLGWTILRYTISYLLFRPLAKWFQMTPTNAQKYPESAWKLIVYGFLWFYTCYVIFGIPENNHFFYDPVTIWKDYRPGMAVQPEMYWLYMLELSFYVHSIYASLYMDEWRKDSVLMMFHHFLTISLIGFSYGARYHKIGVLVLFVHDITDIALEFTKCNVYLKNRAGQYYKFHDIMSTLGFLVFAICWYVFRLYWLPLKILHSTGYGAMLRHKDTGVLPFYFFFNALLWALQALNIWWFMFIINFLIKVATGQIDEVDDIREEEVIKEKIKSKSSNNNSNGSTRSPRGKSKKAD